MKGVALVLKTETLGNPKLFQTGLKLALKNGETCV